MISSILGLSENIYTPPMEEMANESSPSSDILEQLK